MTVTNFLYRPVLASSAAFFRIVFGAVMCFGTLRFICKGWVYDLYIKPSFYFTYYGFSWIKPLPEWTIYSLFALMALLSFFIAIGLLYRLSAFLFFISFTYVELIDATNYLNHYYLISLIGLLIIFLPLNCCYSLDSILKPSIKKKYVPFWVIGAIRLQIGIVYFFGGISKIKYDWLIEAQPLKIWLSSNSHLPVIGSLLDQEWIAYVFSWGAMIFDLSIPFFLIWKSSRIYAFFIVVIFHILTALLFPIGMFPWIMTLAVLVFFSPEWHTQVLDRITKIFFKVRKSITLSKSSLDSVFSFKNRPYENFILGGIGIFFLIQFLMPFRYLLYTGNVLWTEEGYRFSWNIMLMEKRSYIEFKITDKVSGHTEIVLPSEYLTSQQQIMMSTQPDLILQFAHYLKSHYYTEGRKDITINAECYTTLNGKERHLLIDSTVDLGKETDTWKEKDWILHYD